MPTLLDMILKDKFSEFLRPNEYITLDAKSGLITTKEINGGYDPIFLVPELTLSYAQLDKETKALVGHRGKAFARLLPELQELLSINPAAM